MKQVKYFFFFGMTLFFLVGNSGCDEVSNASENMLPRASGSAGEMMIFMDTSLQSTPVGQEMQDIFNSTQPGLLQSEKRFRVNFIDPMKINKFLKRHTNLVFVTLINDNSQGNRKLREFFPEEALKKIKKNPDYFMFTKRDIYAKGQRVLHLFAYKSEDLVRNLQKNKEGLRRVFELEETQRLEARLAKMNQKDAESNLRKTHQVKMVIPKGYKKAKDSTNFMWYRFAERKIDRNIFIAYKNYDSEAQFEPDSMLAWRNELAKKNLFADPKFPESYIKTETLEPPVFQESVINDGYALEMRGLWRTNAKYIMGGPFVSFMFADPKDGRLFYVEGFVYAPGESKRELIRELTTILRSIKPTQK